MRNLTKVELAALIVAAMGIVMSFNTNVAEVSGVAMSGVIAVLSLLGTFTSGQRAI